MNKPSLKIVRGIPGSGKTSFVRTMFPNIFHVENDMFHYHNGIYEFSQQRQALSVQWCIDSITFAMNNGMDIVVSNTFTKKRYITPLIKLAKLYGYEISIFRMMGDFNSIHNVPLNIFQSMKRNFEDYEGEIFVYPTNELGKYEFLSTKKDN